MEVVTLGLLKDDVKYTAMLADEWKRFSESSSNAWICITVEQIRRMKEIVMNVGDACDLLVSLLITSSDSVELIRKVNQVKQDLGQKQLGEKERLILNRLVKIERQRRWLSWLEDMTCCLIEEVVQRFQREKKISPRSKLLYFVLFPEFYFTEYNDTGNHKTRGDIVSFYVQAFYREVVQDFWDGNLPDSGRGLAQTPPKRLAQLSGSMPGMIIFAGTVIWKGIENDPKGQGQYFYNTAPVYYNGSLQIVWDKQYVSDVDGVSGCKSRYRHTDQHGSSFTRNYSFAQLRKIAMPIFRWEVYGKQVSIALSVCMDFAEVELPQTDIQVILSAGTTVTDNPSRISAKKLLIQCESYVEEMYKFIYIIQCKKPIGRDFSELQMEDLLENIAWENNDDHMMVYVHRIDEI